MPVAIFLSAERLILHLRSEKNGTGVLPIEDKDPKDLSHIRLQLDMCVEALQEMQSVNNLAKYYMNILTKSHP
jgi:hypothetical protein